MQTKLRRVKMKLYMKKVKAALRGTMQATTTRGRSHQDLKGMQMKISQAS